MAERYPPAGLAEDRAAFESRDSFVAERQPWSPAQLVAIILGIVFLILGGIAIARTGVDFNQLTSKHVDVAGSTQTQLMGYIELVFGAFLLVVGSIPGAGRGGMSFLGVLALVFGTVVVAQPSSFYHSLGIGKGYAVFLIVAGAVLMVTAMVSPIYWGFRRREGARQRGSARRRYNPVG
jgi:hypothetical protein